MKYSTLRTNWSAHHTAIALANDTRAHRAVVTARDEVAGVLREHGVGEIARVRSRAHLHGRRDGVVLLISPLL